MGAPDRLPPSLADARRVGILGGSFDPPHRGHLHVAESALSALDLDHVLFVPAARPPHKPDRELAPAADRLALVELLVAEEPRFDVWSVELERPGPSFTIDTVRELRRLLGHGVELFLLLGTDNLPGLPSWREAEELLALARPVVARRPGAPPAADPPALSDFARGRLAEGWLEMEPMPASSSELRRRIGEGRDPGDALPGPLGEYILARGLYAGS